MVYELKNTKTGEPAIYKTTLEITETDSEVTFNFNCEHSSLFCPYEGFYNAIHSLGDMVEILIGSDKDKKLYYEIELSPFNDAFISKIENLGLSDKNLPILELTYVDNNFLKTSATVTENGYNCVITFNKKDLSTGDGEFYFNAYRIETDDGYMNKHLFSLFPTMTGYFHNTNSFKLLKDYVTK